MQRVVAAQPDGPRMEHYSDLARHWLALPELLLPVAPNGTATWCTPHLAVSVCPDFAVTEAVGNVMAMKLWLKDLPLGRDAVRGPT
jgi:hypothetical protein